MNKIIADLHTQARKEAKRSTCYLCNRACSSFCNSHSIPKFTLKKIADNGNVSYTLQGEFPLISKPVGIGKSGTFHIICNECDNTSFQEYENPESYYQKPTDKMLSQIALKNYLLMISKRLEEDKFYKILGENYPNNKDFADEKRFLGELDLSCYQKRYEYAKKSLTTKWKQNYYLCYYRVLDYVVPYATQSAITLISDFNDCVINDIYNYTSEYQTKDIHIAVFPLDTKSVVMLFIEEGEKRYHNFYKQLKKLSSEDQLAAINYIILAYTENIFLNPQVHNKIKNNESLMNMCKLTTDGNASFICSPALFLTKAIKEFSLSKRNTIPNLLSSEYAIK